MVTWDDPLVPDQNGIIILYTVAYLNLNRPGDQHINSSTPQRQLSFPGLQEYEEYSFRVAAETTVGQGPFSDPSSVFTFEDGEYIIISKHKLQSNCFVYAISIGYRTRWKQLSPPII